MADSTSVQELMAALESTDKRTRIEAVNQLGKLKAAVAVPKLIEMLTDSNLQIRLAVIEALGAIGDARAIQPLTQMIETASKIQIKGRAPDSLVAEARAALENIQAQTAAIPREIESIKAEKLSPKPKPITPPAQAEADDSDIDALADEEITGSMEPLDLDESLSPAASEALPEPEPAPPPPSIPAPAARPAPAGPLPGAIPQPQPIPQMQSREEPEHARARRQEGSPAPADEGAQTIQFSAYYPREIKPNDWQPLQAYIFTEFAADRVAEDAEKQLGPLAPFRRIVQSARRRIGEGEAVTATPALPGFQFNPPRITVGFFEDWHRFDFKLRAKDAPLNMAANGFLTFTINGIIVADIPLSVFVTEEVTQAQPQGTMPHPVYDTVFASYSHKDTPIVLKVEAAAKTFGMTYLRDVITLRSGEDWSEGLEKMIDQATIFQIFWSPPYSQSQHCRREWEYAVGLKREAAHFIRPVYWLQPMPDPPPLLQHLHFAYQPDLVK